MCSVADREVPQVADFALARQELHSPGDGIHMDVRESQCADFASHFSQCKRRLCHTPDAFDKPVEFINGKVRTAVNKQKGWMLK
jgi:hypothetical protein